MDPSQSPGLAKESHGQPESALDPQSPSIQDTGDQEAGHGAYTPLDGGPVEPSKGVVNTDGNDPHNGDKKDNGKDTKKGVLLGFTRREIGIVLMMGLVEFSVQAFLSLLGPFYTVRVSILF